MKEGQSIRIGIVGAGNNTRKRHIPGLKALENVEIVSVCNRSRDSGEKVAAEFGIPEVCGNWSEIIEDKSVDAVVIGTWPYLHHPITCQALNAGKHVLVEARMAMNAREARDMLEIHRGSPHLIAQVVPSPLTLGYDRMLIELIDEGYLGELYAVDVRDASGGFADPSAPLTWRQDVELSGLNTLSMGIWYEALARWIGHARAVTAMRKVCVKRRPGTGDRGRTVRVPDHVDVLADMACGAQAHMRFSAVTGLAEPASGIWLYGSEGTLTLDPSGGGIRGARRGEQGLKPIPVPPDKAGGWRVEAEFINAIRGLETVKLTTFTEGVKYMEFTEAVARSADHGLRIMLPLTD